MIWRAAAFFGRERIIRRISPGQKYTKRVIRRHKLVGADLSLWFDGGSGLFH